MFYCNECGKERNWPTDTFAASIGTCEICGKKEKCNDVPSKQLPISKDIVQIKAELQIKIIEWLRENKNNFKFNFGSGDPDLTALFMMQAAWQIIEARGVHPIVKKV